MILRINDRFRNRKIDFFTDWRLSLRYDSIGGAFQFRYYFDPENPEHKEFSCVGHYHLCTLHDNDELLLTGFITSIEFADSAVKELTSVAGYSLPGVLEDCEVPIGTPLQSDLLSLKEIAERYVSPFGIQIVIHSSVVDLMNEPFEETRIKETQSIKSYLAELASQKNIIMTHNERGDLVFTKAVLKKPIYHFENNVAGVSFRMKFNGQGIHSNITAIAQADIDSEEQAAEESVDNPYCPIVFRPHVIVQNSGNTNDTNRAAKNALQNELRNITLTITMDRWDLNGKIVKPGEVISVTNPRIYLFKKTNWFIEAVDLSGDAVNKTAVLTCVRPEVYTGDTPDYIFKGINLHYNG